jgi:lysophospholipase L1-like esterase
MTRRSPRAALRTLGALVAATATLAGSAAAAHAAPAPDAPAVAVALGDSYISGEGGRWEGNSADLTFDRAGTDLGWNGTFHDASAVYGLTAANGCHRSTMAEISSADLPGIASRFNIACSGAVTEAVRRHGDVYNGEPPQADTLALIASVTDVQLIVLSIGGNDLGFGDIVTDLVTAWTFNRPAAHHEQQRRLDERLPTAMANVRRTVRSIQQTMEDAGYEPGDYRFVLQSYPSPVPRSRDARYDQGSWDRLTFGGCPVWDEDMDWARNRLVPQIADGLQAVAAETDIMFLDLSHAFAGREVCSAQRELATAGRPPSPERSEWVRFLAGIIQGDLQESLHPNAYGQRALGRCLSLIAAVAEGHDDFACRPGGGEGVDAMVLEPIGGPPKAAKRMVGRGRARPIDPVPWPEDLPRPPLPDLHRDHADEPPDSRDR